jgi:hypothetical protein
MSAPLITILEVEACLTNGEFLLEEQILNKAMSLMHREGTRKPTVSEREGQSLEPR